MSPSRTRRPTRSGRRTCCTSTSPIPGDVTFLDNIWNFSSPAFYLAPGTFYSYGGNPIYPAYYYDFGPSFSITLPLTVQLYLNSSVTDLGGIGYPTVSFGYNIVNAGTGMSEASGVYDTVLFNSTVAAGSTPVAPYVVDGSQFTPTGYIPWDAEIMLGGPGGGTTTSVYGISGSESLQYLSGGSYMTPASTWDVGSETGETSEGIAETYTSPGAVQLSAGSRSRCRFGDPRPAVTRALRHSPPDLAVERVRLLQPGDEL